ncbi:hypothetical protein [Exiguobacterium sp. s154]|uniref:hypothetical protein n=1 Tax=Exiguobacterium sp. s154 TaxID=2751277 RepID=UPI001BE616F4|nr:hypothetical protein [Exiguobacterium sp. s154]
MLGTEQLNSSQVKVKFSEPLLTAGTVTFKYADGSEVAAGAITGTHTAGNDYVTYTLSGVAAGKTVVASFVGAQDYAGNLMSPNPSTATLFKGNLDGTKPVVSSISVLNGSKFEVKFSEQLQALPTVMVGATAATVKQDSTDKTKYIATLAAPVTDLQTVSVSSFTDLSGEVGESYSKVVNFSVDTTAPKLTSTRLVTDAKDAKQYLELTFDENVKLGALNQLAVTGNYVKDYITKPLTSVNVAKANILPVEGTDNTFRILASNLMVSGEDFEGAAYNLTLTGDAEVVVDGSGNKGATVITTSFTRGKDGTVTTTNKPLVKSVAEGADNNEVVVTFDKEVDGASAINTSNYVVNGAVVEKATLAAYDNVAKEQVVTLTLKADSNAFSGNRYVTISGVKAKNGVQMDVDNRIVDLDENVRPTITSAKLTDTNSFNLTFSEKVYNAANAAADFELYVGNVKSAKTLTVEVVASGAAKSQLVVTVARGVTADELSKGLSIKPTAGLDILDTENNKANVTAVTIN